MDKPTGKWIGVPPHDMERLQVIESRTVTDSVVVALADGTGFTMSPLRHMEAVDAFRGAKYLLPVCGELRPVQRREGVLQYWEEN